MLDRIPQRPSAQRADGFEYVARARDPVREKPGLPWK